VGEGARETTQMAVRSGRVEDAEVEAALHQSVDRCYEDQAVIAEDHNDASEPSSVLLAELEGRVAGKLELGRACKARHGFFALRRCFVVHPDDRGRGIGRVLLEHALERSWEQGCAFVERTVEVTNPQAYAWYDREGFGLTAWKSSSARRWTGKSTGRRTKRSGMNGILEHGSGERSPGESKPVARSTRIPIGAG